MMSRILLSCLAALLAAPLPAGDLILFRERNFAGAKVVLGDSNANLSFSPRAVRLDEGDRWQICPRPFFGGQCILLESDTAELRLPRAFSGTVRSARPAESAKAAPPPSADTPAEAEAPKRR